MPIAAVLEFFRLVQFQTVHARSLGFGLLYG